jgi:anti-sigma regulatory factor (Ser/Thr protein kinase)
MTDRLRPLARDKEPSGEVAGGDGLRHVALLYRGQAEYLAAVTSFVREALDRKEPVYVVVPGAKMRLLRAALATGAGLAGQAGQAGEGGRMAFADMARIGRNPARIIPAVRAFADQHPGERVCYLGEPAWPARTDSELREAARHEALINRAFAGMPVTIWCPYDISGLPAAVLTDAERTHPVLWQRGRSRPSAGYLGPDSIPPRCEQPLARPPTWAQRRHYLLDLRPVRDLVASYAARVGLSRDRTPDLVLAVSEVAANTLSHTASGGTVQVWHTGGEILCQIDDNGRIADPLAGQVRPAGDELRGHGLWLVNQVCDLVEVRTGVIGTTIRLHMSLSA